MSAFVAREDTSAEAAHSCGSKNMQWFAFTWVDQEVETQQEAKAAYRNFKTSPLASHFLQQGLTFKRATKYSNLWVPEERVP